MGINKAKINKNSNLLNTDAIKAQVEKNRTELINFSFKYLKIKQDKFNYSTNSSEYFVALKERLKAISGIRTSDLLGSAGKTLRCHPIDFKGTSEISFGIPQEREIVENPFQFSISANNDGRVHGFIIRNTFYVVWLDKEHELYPRKD